MYDIKVAAAAAMVMFGFIFIHTRSIFITLLSTIQITLAFPITYYIYSVPMGVTWFPFLNYLALFILFGIGADDLFIFVDAWRQSEASPIDPCLLKSNTIFIHLSIVRCYVQWVHPLRLGSPLRMHERRRLLL